VEGGVRLRCTVVVDGLPWTTLHAADGRVESLLRPAYLEEREEAAKRWKGRPLPEVDLEHAAWLNVDSPPRLADLRGSFVLVALTDPG
jgi:hypothetical protein